MSPKNISQPFMDPTLNTMFLPKVDKVGASRGILKRSGSWNPFTIKRAFAFFPTEFPFSSLTVFQVRIHLIPKILVSSMPWLLAISIAMFSMYESISLRLACLNSCFSSSVKFRNTTSAPRFAFEFTTQHPSLPFFWRWTSLGWTSKTISIPSHLGSTNKMRSERFLGGGVRLLSVLSSLTCDPSPCAESPGWWLSRDAPCVDTSGWTSPSSGPSAPCSGNSSRR